MSAQFIERMINDQWPASDSESPTHYSLGSDHEFIFDTSGGPADMFLAIVIIGAFTAAANALEGTANYSPAESNIAVKYWVTASASSGNAAAALDGKPDTIWAPTNGQAELRVDLGGTYDAVRKVRVHLVDQDRVYRYRLHGSADERTWRVLADRANNASLGGELTDLFLFPGVR